MWGTGCVPGPCHADLCLFPGFRSPGLYLVILLLYHSYSIIYGEPEVGDKSEWLYL